MKKKHKLFFVSDIHGNYDALISSLKEAQFDENNPDHKLIVLGDVFDRGRQNLEVFTYLKHLTDIERAIVLLGNHGKFLLDYLSGKSVSPMNYIYNGTNETLADFFHQTAPFETWYIMEGIKHPTNADFAVWIGNTCHDIKEEYPDLLPWLKECPYYFESEHYIGVHASLDTEALDWHNPQFAWRSGLSGWDALDFDDGSFLGKRMTNVNGKTVVAGHFATNRLRERYKLGSVDDFSILDVNNENGHKVFIDGCTILTGKVNVYVVEDNLL